MIRRHLIRSVACLAAAVLPFIADPQAHASTSRILNCRVSFSTVGKPVLIAIEGFSRNPCASEMQEGVVGSQFWLDLTELDTGIKLRDRHLQENYLETSKFPRASLTLKSLDGWSPQSGTNEPHSGSFRAVLTLKEVSQEVEGMFTLREGKAEAVFSIDLPQFGIDRPTFMGVHVADDVTIKVVLELEKVP